MSRKPSPRDPEAEAWIAAQPEPDLTDPDNPEWTEADFARAKPPEAFPELMAAIKRGRGRPTKDQPKVAISLRVDAETVERYRATGQGWQGLMNADLAEAAKRRLKHAGSAK